MARSPSCKALRRSRRSTPRSKASAAGRNRSCGTCGSPRAASRATRSAKVLSTSVKPDDIEGRLQLVRLYLDSERYRDAGIELEANPQGLSASGKDLQQDIKQLRQLGAKLILKEIQLRAECRPAPARPQSADAVSLRRRCRRNAAGSPRAAGQIRRPKTPAARRCSTS